MDNSASHKLSVCLLIYNHAHILSEVIKSILDQTFSKFQFIISDDCSNDNSYEIAKRFEKIDSRILVVKTQENIGMAGNTNFAISHAKNPYIALLHHDDIIDKTLFKKWIEVIENSENIGFVFNDYLVDGIAGHKSEKRNFAKVINGKIFLKKVLLNSWGCPIRGTALIRKEYFEEIGGMKEKFGMLADVDLWMRLASKYDVGYVNKPLIEVLVNRPEDYPADYNEFSWKRLFLLFDIHSSNINRENFSNYFEYLLRRFVFRNEVSFEIIKWHLYAIHKNNEKILASFPGKYKYEIFYSAFIIWLINLFKKNKM